MSNRFYIGDTVYYLLYDYEYRLDKGFEIRSGQITAIMQRDSEKRFTLKRRKFFTVGYRDICESAVFRTKEECIAKAIEQLKKL